MMNLNIIRGDINVGMVKTMVLCFHQLLLMWRVCVELLVEHQDSNTNVCN